MPPFRVDSIEIEGFKAFTAAQSIYIGGRHLFVVGDNGRGKSSILEAVRWAIWGGEQEKLIRNAFYQGDCQVELALKNRDGLWRLRRRMRLGSGKSDVSLYDPDGQRRNLEDVLPHLPRISGDGMYIILAEQQARGRAYVDIGRFDEVLHAYLGILDDKHFLREIAHLIEEFEKVRSQIDSDADAIRDKLNSDLSNVNVELRSVRDQLHVDTPPTYDETIGRIRKKAAELGIEDPLPLNTPEVAVRRLKGYLESSGSEAAKERQNELSKLKQDHEIVTALRSRFQTIAKLENLLSGECLQNLRDTTEAVAEQVEQKGLLSRIIKDAKAVLEADSSEECPVCGHPDPELSAKLSEHVTDAAQSESQVLQEHEALEKRLRSANSLAEELVGPDTTEDQLTHAIEHCRQEIRSTLRLEEENEITEALFQDHIIALEQRIKALEKQARNRHAWCEDQERSVAGLQNEVRYHQLRQRQEELRHWMDEGFDRFQQSFEGVDDALEALEEIRDAISQALYDVMARRAEPLSQLMSDVYFSLTDQRSFDTVRLPLESGDPVPELRIKVAASDVPHQLWDYEDVLNGQALAALRLVPYFVFSTLRQDDALPLEILMLDDPSQRFDKAHVDTLFHQLAMISARAQIMIATHEEDRFGPFINKYFGDPSPPAVVRVVDFARDQGPTLEVSE